MPKAVSLFFCPVAPLFFFFFFFFFPPSPFHWPLKMIDDAVLCEIEKFFRLPTLGLDAEQRRRSLLVLDHLPQMQALCGMGGDAAGGAVSRLAEEWRQSEAGSADLRRRFADSVIRTLAASPAMDVARTEEVVVSPPPASIGAPETVIVGDVVVAVRFVDPEYHALMSLLSPEHELQGRPDGVDEAQNGAAAPTTADDASGAATLALIPGESWADFFARVAGAHAHSANLAAVLARSPHFRARIFAALAVPIAPPPSSKPSLPTEDTASTDSAGRGVATGGDADNGVQRPALVAVLDAAVTRVLSLLPECPAGVALFPARVSLAEIVVVIRRTESTAGASAGTNGAEPGTTALTDLAAELAAACDGVVAGLPARVTTQSIVHVGDRHTIVRTSHGGPLALRCPRESFVRTAVAAGLADGAGSLRVTLTGTGNPRPHADRAGPGCLVRCGHPLLAVPGSSAPETEILVQVDCGRGTLMRLAAAGVAARDLHCILLTHLHWDHVSDLADLVMTAWLVGAGEQLKPLRIQGPVGTAAHVDRVLALLGDDAERRRVHSEKSSGPLVQVVEWRSPSIPAGAPPAPAPAPAPATVVVCATGTDLCPNPSTADPVVAARVTISACVVDHGPVEEAAAYRIDAWGRSVVVSGDTTECPALQHLATGAGTLVHEVLVPEEIKAASSKYIIPYHSTPEQVGRNAAAAGVQRIVLTHIIPAGTDSAVLRTRVAAAAGFSEDRVFVGTDLESWEV
jgi:ribonuclease Z